LLSTGVIYSLKRYSSAFFIYIANFRGNFQHHAIFMILIFTISLTLFQLYASGEKILFFSLLLARAISFRVCMYFSLSLTHFLSPFRIYVALLSSYSTSLTLALTFSTSFYVHINVYNYIFKKKNFLLSSRSRHSLTDCEKKEKKKCYAREE
jgi:hypothetical protein